MQELITPPKPRILKKQHIAFPESAYSGVANDFAELFSQKTEVPKPFLFMTFLAYLGAMVSHLIELNSAIRPQPRLYVACLAPTGEKKSTALRLTDNFFRETFPGWDLTIYGSGSFEALAEDLAKDPESKKIRPRILFFDELALFVNKAKQEGSLLLPALCTLFEHNHFDNITKKRELRCRDAYLSLVGACTLETYEKMWTPQFLDMGFVNRLFILVEQANKRVALPEPVDPQEPEPLKVKLKNIVSTIEAMSKDTGKVIFSLDPEAQELWRGYYASIPKDVHAVRLDTYGLRLMLLLALSKREYTITKETVWQVTEILDYEYQVRKLYDPIDAENLNARTEQKILRELEKRGPLRQRDLIRFTNARGVGLWIFRQCLENLKATGDVAYDPESKTYYLPEIEGEVG